MRYPITPVPKPRMTRSDKWKQRPAVLRYRAFKDECRYRGVQLDPARSDITFWIPMPASWSRKKRAAMDGQPHAQKPDLDNLLKALGDALYGDDSVIWQIRGVRKLWAGQGAIEIHTTTEK